MRPLADLLPLDERPIVVAIAGPNGAGKTSFYRAYLQDLGLRYVNADDLARELDVDAREAAALAASVRSGFVKERESFVFETVFSDPVGEKVEFLRAAAAGGYTVILCFIGLRDADQSEERVAMRVAKGGHDVPSDKLAQRYPRSLRNLGRAIERIPYVCILDNGDLGDPFRPVAVLVEGALADLDAPPPAWAGGVIRDAVKAGRSRRR